jgi:hypothetical protein
MKEKRPLEMGVSQVEMGGDASGVKNVEMLKR